MLSRNAALRRLKADLAAAVPDSLRRATCRDLGLRGRRRLLTPAVTARLFLTQVLHGHTPRAHLRHFGGLAVTESAYCQARARLLVARCRCLQRAVTGRLTAGDDDPDPRWKGHRVFLLDGSGFSMPDSPELRAEFGQPGAQAAGCGFPVAHLLALVDAHAGFLVKAVAAPLRTHDLRHVPALHATLQPGDVLVGDRAFGSYAHLALCRGRGLHGLFRAHQRRSVWFGANPRRLRRLGRHDLLVEYRTPRTRPAWLDEATYAALPERLVVRAVRVRVGAVGCRTRVLTLVTTLLDARRYPPRALAALYGRHW